MMSVGKICPNPEPCQANLRFPENSKIEDSEQFPGFLTIFGPKNRVKK